MLPEFKVWFMQMLMALHPTDTPHSDAAAVLVAARLVSDAYGEFLVGDVYDDILNRWEDGRTIHTSRIQDRIGDSTFRTISGSLFTVHSWSVEPNPVKETGV